MPANISIQRATTNDAPEIALLVVEMLAEIMGATAVAEFEYTLAATESSRRDFLKHAEYVVFIARDEDRSALGFISMYENYGMFLKEAFGTIAEIYTRPSLRAEGIGHKMLEHAKSFAQSLDWKRLEVATQPQVQYRKTLPLYRRLGFIDAVGRKLQYLF